MGLRSICRSVPACSFLPLKLIPARPIKLMPALFLCMILSLPAYGDTPAAPEASAKSLGRGAHHDLTTERFRSIYNDDLPPVTIEALEFLRKAHLAHSQGDKNETINILAGHRVYNRILLVKVPAALAGNRNQQSGPEIHSATLLGDYADLLLGIGYQQDGDFEKASKIFRHLLSEHPDSALLAEARLRLAACESEFGNNRAALAELEAIGERAVAARPEALLLKGRCLEALGRKDEAAKAYRLLYSRHPESREADEAEERLKALKARPQDKAILLARLDRLIELKSYKKALAEARALLRRSRRLVGQEIYTRIGICHYNLKNYTGALANLRLTPAGSEARPSALYHIALCQRRLGRDSQHIETIAQLEREHPGSEATEAALNGLAYYYEAKGEPAEAERIYKKLLARFPSGRYAALAHWKLAWQSYLRRDYRAAVRSFSEHIARFPSAASAEAALYWLGRAYAALGEKDRANYLWSRLVDFLPNSLYGMLARRQLKEEGGPADYSDIDSLIEALLSADQCPAVDPNVLEMRIKKFRQLKAIGLSAWALGELEFLTLEPAERAGHFPVSRPMEDNHYFWIRTLRRLIPHYYKLNGESLPLEIWKAFFPLENWSEIQSAARRLGLDPYLISALIRQESTFNSRAVSPSNAIGLMQLLPSTGRSLARKLGYRRFSSRSLYQPALNVKLGSYYLARLIERFEGQIELALAAYNGGPTRVAAWLERYPSEDVYEFIESIPIQETRDYVKLIIATAEHYRRIYGQQ